jgi:hypothetical protein
VFGDSTKEMAIWLIGMLVLSDVSRGDGVRALRSPLSRRLSLRSSLRLSRAPDRKRTLGTAILSERV